MQTQNERLLDYLKKHKRIDPFSAWIKLGIYRLGARIFDLRTSGAKIRRSLEVVQNRFGEECRVAIYSLDES